jgi:CBS domain-containing protein
MRASDVMTRTVISVEPDSSILHAIRVMLEKRVSGLPVVSSKGALVGIVTEGIFSAAPKPEPSASARG